MKKCIVYQIDAFTKQQFKGNPAGVVINADGLDEHQMQHIARELNNSETAFLFSSDRHEYDAVVRYFTPHSEVPVCGHATIAAMYAKAFEEHLDSCVLRIKTGVGILPCEIIKAQNDYTVIMTQGAIHIDAPLDTRISEQILAALGLTYDDIDERCPIQIASTGHSKVMIGITCRETLNRLTPHFTKLAELSDHIRCNGYFVFTLDSPDEDVLTYGRMFAPAIGIHEDPVTGNANGPLGAYLIVNGVVQSASETFEFRAKQGEAIDRLGVVGVKVTLKDNTPILVQIHGEAVVVFKTEMVL